MGDGRGKKLHNIQADGQVKNVKKNVVVVPLVNPKGFHVPSLCIKLSLLETYERLKIYRDRSC